MSITLVITLITEATFPLCLKDDTINGRRTEKKRVQRTEGARVGRRDV